MPDFYYDEEAAERAVEFFPRFLKHVKGEHAGQPFHLLPWQADAVIRPLFGWKREDGSRKYRRVYVEVPRKNGKSQLAAGVGLYLTYSDDEPGAEVYSAASDRDQAAIVFEAASSMVEESPDLLRRGRVYRRSIVIEKTRSSYKVLSSDVGTKHGLNAHGIIFDELHTQPNRALWDVLTTSVGARRQPVTFAITTAGFDRNSICYEQHDYAVKVLEGVIDDPEFLPVIFSAPDNADWSDESVWAAANPSLDQTVKRDYIRAECKRAQETPGYVNTFRRLQLNQWTESFSRWLNVEAWDESGEDIDPADLEGQPCWGGLDLSTTTDISSFVLVFPRPAGFACLAWFWVPEESIDQRSKRDRVPYEVWERQGWIEATEGNVIDYDFIEAKIKDLAERFAIKEIGYDPYNAQGLVNHLADEGLPMVVVRQGYLTLTSPAKELERLTVSKEITHFGNPVLRWCAANVVVEQDAAGNIKPSKAKSTERIDGIAALVTGLSRAVVEENGDSVYEERGLLTI